MIDLEPWIELGLVLSRHKLRTALTALGVFWGMFMLLLMTGFGSGLEQGVQRSLGGWATNAVFVWGRRTSMPHAGLQPGRNIGFENADAVAISELDDVAVIAPRTQLGGWRGRNEIRGNGNIGEFQVMGDVPEIRVVNPVELTAGRWLNPLDMDERRKVAVIGSQVRDELYRGVDPVGMNLLVNGVAFLVVGVFESPLDGDAGERAASTIHVPLSSFQQAFHTGDRLGWITFVGHDHVSGIELEAQVRSLLYERHSIHPDDEPALGSYNAEDEFSKIQNTFAGIRLFVAVVGSLTLLGGVFGVSNILLISVKERTREIGLRRAVGAPVRSILAMVIREALVITLVSGYLGLVCGVALLEGVAVWVGDSHEVLGDPQIDLTVAAVAGGALVLGALLAGFVPARRAAAIHPVEALRAE